MDKVERLKALRARIPDGFVCVEGCEGCCGPVVHSALEQRQIDKIGGVKQPGPGICDCHYLRGTRCSVFSERPIMCRLYGNTPLLPCPYGGKSSKMLTMEETQEILTEYDALVADEQVECTAGTFVLLNESRTDT